MYEQFYGFKTKPFHTVPNPEFFYQSPKHQNALTYLEYGLMERSGFILLTGEIGTGKTTLIKYLTEKTDTDIETAIIFNTNVTSEQLLDLILNEFEIGPCAGDKAQALDILYQFLIEKFSQNKHVLLIIDEAQNLSRDALEEVRMLSNLQSDKQMLLQIMLVGQPELKSRLRNPDLAQLSQRITVAYHLSALNREETGAYIAFRLEKAGGTPNLFTEESIDLIYESSHGIPRIINIICDMSLVYGFADELAIIDAPIIQQVLEDRQGMGLDGQTVEPVLSGETWGGDKELLVRLQNLEVSVGKLQMQVDIQMKELERMAEEYKINHARELKELYTAEREKNDKLLLEYAKLKEKYLSIEDEPLRKLPDTTDAQRAEPDKLTRKNSPVVERNERIMTHKKADQPHEPDKQPIKAVSHHADDIHSKAIAPHSDMKMKILSWFKS